jgi:hypothetical protein
MQWCSREWHRRQMFHQKITPTVFGRGPSRSVMRARRPNHNASAAFLFNNFDGQYQNNDCYSLTIKHTASSICLRDALDCRHSDTSASASAFDFHGMSG